jgi:ribose 5-phosphate isomerase B
MLLLEEKKMKIVVVSDEIYPINFTVINWLKEKGFEVSMAGALVDNPPEQSWVKAIQSAALSLVNHEADEGIFFCWTGTGASIIANRYKEIRAALCTDAETARAARVWNHANVLVLSNRLISDDVAKEILAAWFDEYDKVKGQTGAKELTTAFYTNDK